MTTIETLFYHDQLKAILDQTLDSDSTTLAIHDVPFVIGALTFLGRLEDAISIFQHHNESLTIDQRIVSRFFLGISLCRHYKFQDARGYLIANVRDRALSVENKTQFYILQGLGMYRYTYGHLHKALYWSSRALNSATANQFGYGRILAMDLKIHALCNAGQIRQGLRLMAELEEIAPRLGFESAIAWIRVSKILYQSNFGILGIHAVPALQDVLESLQGTDNFSRASLYLEISRQQLLAGDAEAAKRTLDSSLQDVYQADNLRLETLLKLRLCHYLYARGERDQTLKLLRSSLQGMAGFEDKVLEQRARGFEAKVLTELNKTDLAEQAYAELEELQQKSGLYLARRILRRRSGTFERESIPGHDPLGDTLDLIRADPETSLGEISANGWFGLFYDALGISRAQKTIYLDAESSGSVTLFDRGDVEHQSRPLPPLIRKLFLSLAEGEQSKQAIVESVWGYTYNPQRHDNLVYTLVGSARKQLGGRAEWINAVPAGYKLADGVEVKIRAEIKSTLEPTVSLSAQSPEIAALTSSKDLKNPIHSLNFRQKILLEKEHTASGIDTHSYMEWFKVSEATAIRDLRGLVNLGLLRKTGNARSTKYFLLNH